MTEQLPISIYVCDDLIKQFVKIHSITNKLSAQLNFQTMTANWYGEEDNIFFIQLLLETPSRFTVQKENQEEKQQKNRLKTFEIHSDDVFSYIDEKEPMLLIFTIAITECEQNLLTQQEKVLAGLLQIKLQKVLNIVAKQFNFNLI